MFIAVNNQSTLVTNDQVNAMCLAIQIQLDLHFLPAWNLKSGTIRFYADATKAPGHAWVMNVLDNTQQAGALGYHAENNDKVIGFVFAEPVLSNSGVVLYDSTNPQNISISSVLSHECLEMAGDRFANQWASGPNVTAQNGRTYDNYAFEMCDPVEGDSYSVNVGTTPVSLSNFIFPSWFNLEATVALNMPFDYLHKLSKPFSMSPGGYMIVQQGGDIQQVFGDQMKDYRKEQIKSEWYRR